MTAVDRADMMCAVTKAHTKARTKATTKASMAGAPPAARTTRPGWRDPRLWIGVAIVAVCVIVGARVLAGADDTVAVWALGDDHPAGSVLGAEDLTARQVRFADVDDLARYYRVGDRLPDRLTLLRAVGSGELLPRGAVGDGSSSGLAQLPVAVEPAGLPAGLAPGSAVDLYVVGRGAPGPGPARVAPVLAGVTVVDIATDDLSGADTMTLAVPAEDVARYFASIAGADDAVVTVVGRP